MLAAVWRTWETVLTVFLLAATPVMRNSSLANTNSPRGTVGLSDWSAERPSFSRNATIEQASEYKRFQGYSKTQQEAKLNGNSAMPLIEQTKCQWLRKSHWRSERADVAVQ